MDRSSIREQCICQHMQDKSCIRKNTITYVMVFIMAIFLTVMSNFVYSWGQPENKSTKGYGTTPWGASGACPTGASGDTCKSMGSQSTNPIGVYHVPKIGADSVQQNQYQNKK
jgi:hypothetical protein